MATATRTARGFQVTCPLCRDEDATVTLDLNDLTECRCSGCDETFSPMVARDLVAEQLRKWEAICKWIEMAGGM